MKGEVVYYRLFDIGAAIDLDEVQRRVAMPFLSGRIVSERAAPKYARLGQPLLVHLDQRELDTNLGRLTFNIAVRLFGVGALSVVLRTPFEAANLRDLRPYGSLRIKGAEKDETLDDYCARVAGRIEEDLVPYMHDSYDVKVDAEPYTIYCVTVSEHPVRTFANGWRRDVTALLAGDPRPDDISDEEVEDTWRGWLSYYQDDLVVVEWDAALVIEPTSSYEDTLAVLEIANLQLLELRTYDAYLDKAIDKAYDDLEDLFRRSSLLRSGGEEVKELAELRMDLSEATFQVDNISKLWGDWFLGKVYRASSAKFELESWRRTVAQKMQDLSDIYQVAQAEFEGRRMFILEFLVVLLFVIDLLLIAFHV